MEDLRARAELVSAPNLGDGPTTSIARSEVREALDADAPLDLVLDLTRFSAGEPTKTRGVKVAWERDDLERLLAETEGDQVVLTFDRNTLWQAMETDVEAHGLKEKVLVLAVAATAAGGAAAAAAAEPGPLYGGGQPAIQKTLGPDDRAVSRATPTPQPPLGVDDRAVSRSTPTPQPPLGVDDRAVSRSTPTPQPPLGVDDRAVSRATPEGPGLGVDDRSLARGTTPYVTSEPVSAVDAGGSWSPSPAETAAVGGAIALAITGAAFVATGRRRRHDVRPA